MSEILTSIRALILGPANRLWLPQVYTRALTDQMWEAWIEFRPLGSNDTAPALRITPATQRPTREGILEWARGLTYAYLGDALNQIIARDAAYSPPVR